MAFLFSNAPAATATAHLGRRAAALPKTLLKIIKST